MLETAIRLTKDGSGRHPNESGFDPDDVVQYGYYDPSHTPFWGWMFGGEGAQTELEDRLHCKVGGEKFIEGTQFWQDMVYKWHVMPAPFEREEFQGLMSSPFHTGKVAMTNSKTWNVNSYKDIEDFSWDFAAEIHGPVRDRYNDRLCMDQGTMFKSASFHDESWEWLKFLASDEMAYRYSVDLRECLPARLSHIPKYNERLQQTAPGVDGDVVAEALKWAHYQEYWAPPTDWSEIWTPYKDMINMQDATPGEVFPEAQEKIQANWDEFYSEHPVV